MHDPLCVQAASKLQVVTTNQDQWLTVVQTAVQFGTPVLIKDVGETLPSALGVSD